MRSYRQELVFNLPARMAFRNITGEVERVVAVTGGRLDFGPREQVFYGE
jgi:hypothetical protein